PRFRPTPEAVDRTGSSVRRTFRTEEDARVATGLARDREPTNLIFEHSNQAIARRVDRVKAIVDRAAELREQPELLEAPVAACAQALELGQHPFTSRLRSELGLRTDELLRQGREPEAELVLQAHGAEEPERIVREHRL